ncbi:MAG: histidine kinase dimerization/phospho-acceptor domain-containing protein, partial [Planctomycetota bacterium]|nr:histidine kinase dimerization/phospho-acceptor domain-containing protein [Planctomycetota bacterium]
MGSARSSRKYTYAVILVGVVGLLAVTLFVLWAGQKIASQGQEEFQAKRREVVPAASNLLVRAWARVQTKLGSEIWREQRHGPLTPATWDEIQQELPLELLEYGHLAGLEVETPSGDRVWSSPGLAQMEAASLDRSAPFSFPDNAAPEDAARVRAVLDLGDVLRDRRDLTDFVILGVISIAVAMYVLTAVIIILNRAQIRLQRIEHEKTTRLNAIGEVAGGIAHEVRNPLNAISLSVQYMQKIGERGGPVSTEKDFARIHLELGKIRKVVDSFVKFARIRDMVVAPMDLGEVMDEAVARFSPDMETRSIRRTVAREGDLACSGDKEKILEVFVAVLQNAIDAMRDMEAGELGVRIAGRGRSIRATVRDTGDVVDESSLTNIFEP